MSYRITDINFDPSRRDEFLAFTYSQREKIQAVNGLKMVHVAEVVKVNLLSLHVTTVRKVLLLQQKLSKVFWAGLLSS